MELRRAERKDAAAISRVHAASWKSGYRGMIDQGYLDGLREDHWVLPMSQWLESGSLEAVIAWEDGEAAGCVAYGQITPPTGASGESAPPQGYGYILSLYVHPRYFRRGYGRALLVPQRTLCAPRGMPAAFSMCWIPMPGRGDSMSVAAMFGTGVRWTAGWAGSA